MDVETWENPIIEEQHSKLLYGHSESYHAEPHKGINNEDMEKQCCEKIDVLQLLEYQSQLSSSHIEFAHELEPLGAYTMNYHPVSLDDQYDGVVNLPHTSTLSSHG